jgi:hypothetical protein
MPWQLILAPGTPESSDVTLKFIKHGVTETSPSVITEQTFLPIVPPVRSSFIAVGGEAVLLKYASTITCPLNSESTGKEITGGCFIIPIQKSLGYMKKG